MPEIDLGVDYEDIKDADKSPVVATGTYELTCKGAESRQAGPNAKTPGRPMLWWKFTTVDPESGHIVPLSMNTVLPFRDDATGEINTSGCGTLVNLCKGLGKPWVGQKINPDEYIGLVGQADVQMRSGRSQDEEGNWKDDPNKDPVNEIKKFHY